MRASPCQEHANHTSNRFECTRISKGFLLVVRPDLAGPVVRPSQLASNRVKPADIFGAGNPFSGHFPTDLNISSSETAESTNGPPIEETKEHNLLGTSGAFSLIVAGRLRSDHTLVFGSETK
jgi:hypothetical protein